jgi:flavodoxin
MKALIVYDSVYGNTEKVVSAIAEGVASHVEVKVLRASEADISELSSGDLLIAGCPTHGGRPTQAMQDFLGRVPRSSLGGIKVAAFDTRVAAKWVKILGFAAGKIADSLQNRGAKLVVPPHAFYVKGKEGPLKEGELERAVSWAGEILSSDR